MGGSSCPSPPSTSRPGRPTISLWSSSVRSRAEGPRGDGARPREGPPSQSTSSAASSYGGPARAPPRSPPRPRRGPSAGTSSSAALPPRSSPRCAPRRGAARPRGGSPPGGAGPPAAPPPDGRSWQIPPQRLLVVEGGRLDVQRLRAGEEAVLPPVDARLHPAPPPEILGTDLQRAAQEPGLGAHVVAHADRHPLLARTHEQRNRVDVLLFLCRLDVLLRDADRHRRLLDVRGASRRVEGSDEQAHPGV